VGGTQTNFDFADYGGTTGPIVANLATGVATGDGTDTLIDLEGVIGIARQRQPSPATTAR
jgi:hypothetical protein